MQGQYSDNDEVSTLYFLASDQEHLRPLTSRSVGSARRVHSACVSMERSRSLETAPVRDLGGCLDRSSKTRSSSRTHSCVIVGGSEKG